MSGLADVKADEHAREVEEFLEDKGFEQKDGSPFPQHFRGEETAMKSYELDSSTTSIHLGRYSGDFLYVTFQPPEPDGVFRSVENLDPGEISSAIEYFREEERVSYSDFLEFQPQESPEETIELLDETIDAMFTLKYAGYVLR